MRKIKADTKRRVRAAALCASTVASVGMLALTASVAFLRGSTPRQTEEARKTYAAVQEGGTGADGREQYVIKEYNGQVCVFHSGYAEIPAVMTQINANSLGEYDRELVKSGIYVSSREDVLKYLENFMS